MSGEGERMRDEGSKRQVVIAGATAGLVSRFCIAPLDVVKIRLQLQVRSLADSVGNGKGGVPGAIQIVKETIRHEGIRGLWKGNIPAELLYLFYGGIQFSIYRHASLLLHQLVPQLPNSAESFIAGALSGGVATTLTYPLDLLRTRFAAQGNEKIYASLRASIRDIYQHEGTRGYFQGLGAGVSQILPYMGLFFATYEALRPPLASLHLPFGSSDATAGVLAGIIAKTGVFPLDLIRKRLQVQGPTRCRYVYQNIPVYRGVWGSLRTILKHEGPRGLYRGLTVSLLKAAPTSAITMWTYERSLTLLMEMDRRRQARSDRGVT